MTAKASFFQDLPLFKLSKLKLVPAVVRRISKTLTECQSSRSISRITSIHITKIGC